MLDSKQFDGSMVGRKAIDIHAEVHMYKMRKAAVVRQVIASDLGGSVPSTGRQYLTVGTDRWRIAMESGSDNSTEAAAHGLVGVVCVFGEPPPHALGPADLYARYGQIFTETQFVAKIKTELKKVWP
jgi:hypothetical protein